MIALLFFVATAMFLGYVGWTGSIWRRRGVGGPRGLPLVGNMWRFCLGRRHYGQVYEDLYKAHPRLAYVGIYRVFNEPALLLRDLALVKEVMVRSFAHFEDNVLWVDPGRDPVIGCNPFVARGARWKRMRAEIAPIFTPNKVRASFAHIKAVCRRLEEFVAARLHQSFEAKDLFSKFTLDVVASAAYGLDAQSFARPDSDFTRLVEHLFQPNALSLLDTVALLFSPSLGQLIKYHYVPPGVQKWLSTIIGSVVAERTGGSSAPSSNPGSDFIQWLLEAKRRAREPVDVATIVGHCGTFLLEGFETSSSLMAFTLFEYARNPLVQARVLREIDDVLGKHGNEISHEALQEMPYFEASLFETLRMHPPMLALLKHCTRPFELPPQAPGAERFTVDEGTVVVVPVRAIHYDPALYPEPTVFKPERFSESSERPSCAFLGFGEGPRMCPGMRFGLAQSKAGLVTLLAKYSVHPAEHSPRDFQLSPTTFLTAAANGTWLKFRERK